ncbi:hypothetical protein D9619_007968 [Psilocybe cf. subviscida]|uniref:GH16 domain-containing protein n=1 Tax=Psilocybe cf. subviscida TaxID=2480587 RepID=A0A8H5ATW4_9AGAR|nr:hypothetical protein D9619_007968 [Psilocybe cf. subviscida]
MKTLAVFVFVLDKARHCLCVIYKNQYHRRERKFALNPVFYTLKMLSSRLSTQLLPLLLFTSAFAFDVVKDYSGNTFFDEWDFYGHWDNLTLGDVVWVDRTNATEKRLAYLNEAGNAILKVDTSPVVWDNKRDSVRITSQREYDIGSLWIIDVVHLPTGCSVWPAFWTKGHNWPDDGEIDIIEGINRVNYNQMALHTLPGCTHVSPAPPTQRGRSGQLDCSVDAGCTVIETSPNSFGEGFNAVGGGVWATQFDESGIYIWFWSRNDIPRSITESTPASSIQTADWGNPSAFYPSGPNCDIASSFSEQSIVITITLCGTWAGNPDIYNPQCGSVGEFGKCYEDNVMGDGSNYNDAYFEIKYIRAYAEPGSPAASSVTASVGPSATGTSPSTTDAPSPTIVGNSASTVHVGSMVAFAYFVIALGV